MVRVYPVRSMIVLVYILLVFIGLFVYFDPFSRR